MPFNAQRRLILAKINTDDDTDSTPAGSNAILTSNLQRKPYEGNLVERAPIQPFFGSNQQLKEGAFITLSFDVELAGSSAAGTAPQMGVLFRACGMAEVIVATTSVTYNPISTAQESCTIYYNYDGEEQKLVGARGTFSISLAKGGIPKISFTFTGRYARPTAVSMYTPTFSYVQPLPFNDTNTTSFKVHSDEVVGESFTLDIGNTVVHRDLPNYTGTLITNRKSKGQVVFEAPAIATKDVYASVESHGSANVVLDDNVIVHGVGAGKVCTITVPTAQLTTIDDSESDGLRTYTCDYLAIPTNAGNNEFSIAFT